MNRPGRPGAPSAEPFLPVTSDNTPEIQQRTKELLDVSIVLSLCASTVFLHVHQNHADAVESARDEPLRREERRGRGVIESGGD